MEVTVRQVTCRSDLRDFIFLPEKLHAGHPNWLPPFYKDEWTQLDPNKNRAFSYCDTVLLLAFRGSGIAGRAMGIINRRYNHHRSERSARFACLEAAEDDDSVLKPLLDYIENWAREKGMEKIIGPFGFSDQDPSGFLVEGFEFPPTISTYFNFEWMPAALERRGYEKEVDYVTYRIAVPDHFPEHYHRMFERIRRRGRLEIVRVHSKKEAEIWARPALRLMNESYDEEMIYGFSPMDDAEVESLLRRYLAVLDPRFLFGVRGFSLWNALFACVFVAWCVHRMKSRERLGLPRTMVTLIVVYFPIWVVCTMRGAMDVESINAYTEGYTVTTGEFLADNLFNPIKYMIPALMVFDACRNRKYLIWMVV
ncbi:MAG: hypothetical protein C4576_00555, partial [Desulfobacteraceae bacterium]